MNGNVAPGFEPVADAFERNFTELAERGAAFAAVRDGELVVDLWGGEADGGAGAAWEQDTVAMLFSGTKGLVALCMLMLADRGQLDLEAPVATYWPEFAANGKGAVTVLDVAAHRARLPAVRAAVSYHDLLDPARLASLVASQPQESDPRVGFAYHAMTYGWLCAELIRRIDGRTVGRLFADEIAAPLGLELWIGLPEAEEPRVARLEYGRRWRTRGRDDLKQDELAAAVLANPPLLPAPDMPWNRGDWHRAEMPASNAIGTARSVARLYGCLARGGELGGVRLLSERATMLARRRHAEGVDPFTNVPMAFGVGFGLQTELGVYGPPRDAYGFAGAGGSVHGAWPGERTGFSYLMNQLRNDAPVDPRPARLLRALHDALAANGQESRAGAAPRDP